MKRTPEDPRPAEELVGAHARFTPLPRSTRAPIPYDPLHETAAFLLDAECGLLDAEDAGGDPVAPPDELWEIDEDEDDALECDAFEDEDEGGGDKGGGGSVVGSASDLGDSLGDSEGESLEESLTDVVDALDMLDRMGMAGTSVMRTVASAPKVRSFFKTRRPRPNACQSDVVYSGPRLCREPL